MKKEINAESTWQKCNASVFWGEIAPQDHLVQIYDQEEILLQSLLGFITTGIRDSNGIVIIAREERLQSMYIRLKLLGFSLDELMLSNVYIPLSAQELLGKFMVNGMPDEEKFMTQVKALIAKSRSAASGKVRAYGEMVAILWEQGNSQAAIKLEELWNKFCAHEVFTLFCAYPSDVFEKNKGSINCVCSLHTKIISGKVATSEEVFYKRQ